MTAGRYAWMTAEPQGQHFNLYLHHAEEEGAVESQEIMMNAIPAYAGQKPVLNPLPDLSRVAARVRNVLLLRPEHNLVDELMIAPVGVLLDEYDDVAAFAKSLRSLDGMLENGQLYAMGPHLIRRMDAQLWRKIGSVLARFDRPFLIGNQRKLVYDQGRAESDLARGCFNQLAIQ